MADFDLATAKPVDEGFDLATAKPVQPEVTGGLEQLAHMGMDIVGGVAHGLGTAGDVARNDKRVFTDRPTVAYGSPESYGAQLSAPFQHEPDNVPNNDPKEAIRQSLPKLDTAPISHAMNTDAGRFWGEDLAAPAMDIAQAFAGLAGVPGAVRAVGRLPLIRPATQFISDVAPGGGQRAATRIIQEAAGDHQAAAADLQRAGASDAIAARQAGFQPTTAQLGSNAGLAQLDRTLRNQPELTQSFRDVDSHNQDNIKSILEGISGSPQDRLRAGAARDYQARTMYDDALNNPEHFVQPPTADARSFAAEEASKTGLPASDGTPSTNDPNAPAQGLNDIGTRLQELLKRPAMQKAMLNASTIAANFGKPLDERNLIQQMHYAKMHLDDQIKEAKAAGRGNDLRALIDTKQTLLGVMDDLSPAYQQARQDYQELSRPVNRMDVGEALRKKYATALSDYGGTSTRPATLMNALREDDGDQIARTATDFQGATLRGTLNPGDLGGLDAIQHQLGRENFAQNAGRAVGSNTGQNLANQRALDDVGSVHGMLNDMGVPAGTMLAFHHPAVAIGLGLSGRGARLRALHALGEMALDPAQAAKALAKEPASLPPPALTLAPLLQQPPQNFSDLSQ